MNNKIVLLIASLCALLRVVSAEAGVAIPGDGLWGTYWGAQYPWCLTGGVGTAGADLFVCRRNVRIVPIEGTQQLLQLGLLWKERTNVAANQVATCSGSCPSNGSAKTKIVYKLRRMWTTATSNLEKCGTVTDCQGTPTKNQWYTYDINGDGFKDTARQFVYAEEGTAAHQAAAAPPSPPAAAHVYSAAADAAAKQRRGPNDYTAGDLVPMRGCVYKLSLSSGAAGTNASTKHYRVERLKLDILYNYALALKENRIHADHAVTRSFADTAGVADALNYAPAYTDAWGTVHAAKTHALRTSSAAAGRVVRESTFNTEGEEINFYPGWGGFYYVSQGWLNIIWDTKYPIDDYYGCKKADWKTGACLTKTTLTDRDTCHADTPLFKVAADMAVARVSITECEHLGLRAWSSGASCGDASGPANACREHYRVQCASFRGEGPDQSTAASRSAWLTHHTFSVTWMWYMLGNNYSALFYLKGRPDRVIAHGMGRGSVWYAQARYDADQLPREQRYSKAADYVATRPYVQCAISNWRLTNGLTSMEKYGVNQSWEGCGRTAQYRAPFEYVDYLASDKVIKRDPLTMQYTEFLYLPAGSSGVGGTPPAACPAGTALRLTPAKAGKTCAGPKDVAGDGKTVTWQPSCWCLGATPIAWSPPLLSIAPKHAPHDQVAQLRMIQQRGEMYAGRAQYAVTREQPAILQRYSTALVQFAGAADTRSATWQSGDNDISFYATSSETGWSGRTDANRAAAVGLGPGAPGRALWDAAVAAGRDNSWSAGVAWKAAGAAFERRFYYSEEPILLRYHLISPQPGVAKGAACSVGAAGCPPGCQASPNDWLCTTTVPATFAARQTALVTNAGMSGGAAAAARWVYTGRLWKPSTTMYVGVLNMRNARVTHRIPLEDCGDAKVNVTAYEDCDIVATAGGAYNYGAAALAAGATAAVAPGATSTGVAAAAYTQAAPGARAAGISNYDYALGAAPAPAFWQKATRKYYRCGEICLKEEAPTCGDSRASNGADGQDLRTPGVAGVLREACDEGPQCQGANCAASFPAQATPGTHALQPSGRSAGTAQAAGTAGASPWAYPERQAQWPPITGSTGLATAYTRRWGDYVRATTASGTGAGQAGWATKAWPLAQRRQGSTPGCTGGCAAVTNGWECPMWGYSCNEQCGNGMVNDAEPLNGDGDNKRAPPGADENAPRSQEPGGAAPTTGSEECDLGEYNVDLVGLAAREKWLYPCTAACLWNRTLLLDWAQGAGSAGGKTVQTIWDCANVAAAHPDPVKAGAGKKRYVTSCRLLVGNGRLDVLAGETCEPGLDRQPASAVHATAGWTTTHAWQRALWKPQTGSSGADNHGPPQHRIDVAKLWAVGAAGAGGIGEATGVAGSLSTWGCHMGPVASCRATAAVPHATDKANCEAIEAERGRGWDGGPGVDELATAARCAAVTKAVGGGAACTWLSATDVKAQPRLAQARPGWLFPKVDQCAHPSLQQPKGSGATPLLPAALCGGVGSYVGAPAVPHAHALLGTATCGDFVMDGPLGDVPRSRQELRQRQPWQWAGGGTLAYYSGLRALPEQCDNGGLTNHGCDRLCQVVAGYVCRHWLRSVGLWEVPVFGSHCELDGYAWSTRAANRRRRLHDTPTGQRYSAHGRHLAHIAATTLYRRLPQPVAQGDGGWEKNALVLYQKAGLSGQLRIIESNLCVPSAGADLSKPGCYGATWAYTPTASGSADVVYWDVSDTAVGGAPAWDALSAALYPAGGARTRRAAHAQAARVYYGKQRGVFGPYLVTNSDEYVLEFWGYKGAGAADQVWAKHWASTKVQALQLLGAHEYYYWPGRSMLLARLADGASFRYWRFNEKFDTQAASNDASGLAEDKITQTDLALLQVNGRVTVPPVFYADYAAFYCTDADAAAGSSRAGWIRIYKYSTQMHQLELVKEERVVAAETSAEYGRYSLVKLGADGFLFKEAGVATLHRFPITSAAGVGITALLGSTAAFARVTTTALVADEALSCTETATVSVAADKAACAAVAGADLATAVKCNSIVTAAAFALSATTPKACTYTYAASGGTLAGAAGTANKKGFIMQQVSEDPASYALANVPAIYGWLNEGGDAGKPPAFFKLRWSNASGGTLTAVDVTMVPVKYAILLKPEHVSFGRNYVAIMSALDCAATAAGSLVGQHQVAKPGPFRYYRANTTRGNLNPSIRYFKLGTRPQRDADLDGYDDAVKLTWTDDSGRTYEKGAPVAAGDVQECVAKKTECDKGNLLDYDLGWLCRDIPDTEVDSVRAAAWTVTAADPNAAP